jgi:hypothetical protein
MKNTVLFILNEPLKNGMCAIDFTGKLYANALELSCKYEVKQFYASNGQDVINLYRQYNPKVIFYFFCSRTAPWMMETLWKKEVPCKNIAIDVDIRNNQIVNFKPGTFYNFDAIVGADSTLKADEEMHFYKVNQLRPDAKPLPYIEQKIPKIGFHGSPTLNKGLVELVELINFEFDEAEINFHCPIDLPNSGHSKSELMNNINNAKSRIYKSKIKFNLTTDIVPYDEVVRRISQNTINCYFNTDSDYASHASSIHTALSARRPIAIKKSRAHLAYLDLNPSICIEDSCSLKDIIANGFGPLEELYNDFSPENVCKDFEKIIHKLLNPVKLSFSL